MLWRKIILGLSIALNVALLGRLLLSDQGLFSYNELKAEFSAMQVQLRQLEESNVALSREIRLLQTDSEYIEKVIRQRMNFVKDNEVLYIFPNDSSERGSGAVQDEGKD